PVVVYQSPSTDQPYPAPGLVTADSSGYAYFYAPAGLYRIQSNDLNIDWRDVNIIAPADISKTPDTVALRDANGRIKAAAPDDNDDVVTKGYGDNRYAQLAG